MKTCAILIPTFGRAERIPEIVAANHASGNDARLHFVIEEQDEKSIEACVTAEFNNDVGWHFGDFGNYAKAINAGFDDCSEPYVFTGADDIDLSKPWLPHALERMIDPVQVVGTNDLHNGWVLDGNHATHYLVDRRYVEEQGGVIDEGPGSFLWEGYDHNYTDLEFIETAISRGVFTSCLDAVVEHQHPDFGFDRDETYEKTRRGIFSDKARYEQRKALWSAKVPA